MSMKEPPVPVTKNLLLALLRHKNRKNIGQEPQKMI